MLTLTAPSRDQLVVISRLVAAYVVVVAGTIAALVILAAIAPAQATPEAWGHAVVVGVFAVLLPVRLRTARRGGRRALVAVGVIAAVLVVVNVVEALVPGLFPGWMRLEMVGIAVLMAALALMTRQLLQRVR
jgi:uncharacterized membrane protein